MTNNLNAQIFKIKKCTAERFGEKFNEGIRKKDFLSAKAIHRNKSI